MTARIFANRYEAGLLLAEAVRDLGLTDPVVVGLPRGGVVVAARVAERLNASLDVIVVRKIGVPNQPEVAMGAVGEDETCVRDEHLITTLGISDAMFDALMLSELGEVEKRVERYRRHHPRIDLTGRVVIIVDDGIATGSTALAAVRVARAHGATEVIVAVPVCSPEARRLLLYEVDHLVSLQTPERLLAVGYYYKDFTPVPDSDVEAILRAHEV